MNRNFLLLWQGRTVSQIGSQISTIATLLWIKHSTESPALMGAIAMISGLAGVLFSPIGGAFADRYSRRSIILICNVINGCATLFLSLLMFVAPAANGWTVAWIFVVSIILSIVKSFFVPAISASTVDLVPKEKVAGANSMLQASIQISALLGEGAGGLFYRILGAPLVLLIDGVTYLFFAFSVCFITIPQTLPEKCRNWQMWVAEFRREILEGRAYLRANAGMVQLLLVATFWSFFTAPIIGLLPFYVEDNLKLHPDWLGYLLAADGIGYLGGCMLAGIVTTPSKSRAKLLIMFMTSLSVLYVLLGVVKTPEAVVAIMMGSGVAFGFMNITLVTIFQLATPSKIRGRVFGLISMISACLLPIGDGLGGIAASLVEKNIPVIYLFCGGCMALVTLSASALSGFRAYLAFEPNGQQGVAQFGERTEKIVSAD